MVIIWLRTYLYLIYNYLEIQEFAVFCQILFYILINILSLHADPAQ